MTTSRSLCAIAVLAGVLLGIPARVSAQAAPASTDRWEVDIAPLYLWASALDGRLSAGSKSAPLFMSFGDAASQLAGTFTVHAEARKNRWGGVADVSFVRLTTDTTFTTPIFQQPIDGTAKLDIAIFEAGVSYLAIPSARLSVVAGVRTYTLGPKLTLEGAAIDLAPIDTSRTAIGVFGGFLYRPKLSDRWTLATRADLGAGEAFTWSGTIGFDYRIKPWGSVGFGFRALGIDTGNAHEGTGEVEYDVIHYGPIVGMTLHFTQK